MQVARPTANPNILIKEYDLCLKKNRNEVLIIFEIILFVF